MIPFVAKRSVTYILSLILVVISVIAYIALPTRYGIDMTGGTVTDYTWSWTLSDEAINGLKEEIKTLSKEVTLSGASAINDTLVYRVAGTNTLVVEAGFNRLANVSAPEVTALKESFNTKVNTLLTSMSSVQFAQAQYRDVGAAFGDYIRWVATKTLILVVIAISLYIAYAFRGSIEGIASWPFAAVTAISLVHDVVITFGLYIIASWLFPEFKIDTFFVTAMLTVLGYSVNDTIVVMDRIRSDLQVNKKGVHHLDSVINTAINETLTRSIYTSLTIVFVLVAMFLFGPEAIRGFTLALIFGTLVGTYSSIAIAAPLMYDLTKKK